MKRLSFVKMVGAGNDFIVVDNRPRTLKKDLPKLARLFSDRKRSIGADGLLLVERSKKADVRMRIFNPDGSEADMCGNGVRCIAHLAVDRKITKPKLTIETGAGIIGAEVKGDIVKAKLVTPKDLKLNFQIHVRGKNETLSFINTGVPHTVKLVESVEHCDVENLGRSIRTHEHFAPKGTNVSFVSVRSNHAINIRTYERGVEGETLSCGTGSTAGALIAAALKNLDSPVLVYTRSGEVLKVYFVREGSRFTEVYLEGRVTKSFEGSVRL